MSTPSAKATPAQSGVVYISGDLPTFETASIVPVGDSCTLKEIGEVVKTKNNQAVTDNIGTEDHGVVISGDFKVKAGSTIPNKGDVITTDVAGSEAAARAFVITSDVEATAFSTGGTPLMIKFDAEFYPAIDAVENP